MGTDADTSAVIWRSDKGLTISGTRVTLYTLLDYLHAQWSYADIRDWLNLTDDQLRAALAYIAANRDEVDAEYGEVVRNADARRGYWEELLREHLARTKAVPPTPEKAALYARLAQQRAQTIRALTRDDADEHATMARP